MESCLLDPENFNDQTADNQASDSSVCIKKTERRIECKDRKKIMKIKKKLNV